MSSPPQRTTDRRAQKLRTREALLAAAHDLAAEGRIPTLAETADAARVSRATVYRYFSTQESLLAELPLDVAAPTPGSLFGTADAPTDPEDRAALVQNALYDLSRDYETEFRLFLRNALLHATGKPTGTPDPFRGARRTGLLDAALKPLVGELDATEIKDLKVELSMLVGIESMIVLRDVLQLDHEQSRAAGERAVRRMVRAARNGVNR